MTTRFPRPTIHAFVSCLGAPGKPFCLGEHLVASLAQSLSATAHQPPPKLVP
ncbi:hypothetical protein Mapa_015256 [Marchantia paleacea]|nr:hypothetical protein Mapa_015256 [Marchantia paleacea]